MASGEKRRRSRGYGQRGRKIATRCLPSARAPGATGIISPKSGTTGWATSAGCCSSPHLTSGPSASSTCACCPRRQGVGRVLTSRGLVAARERGAGVARLFTTWDNVAAQAMFGAFGFTRIAQVTYYEAAAEDAVQAGATSGSGPGQWLVSPGADVFERMWGWLEQSNLAPFNGGLEFLGWAARALTEPRLRAYLAAGEVLTLEEWDTIQALAIVRDQDDAPGEPSRLEVCYLDGMADGIGRLALALRAIAAQRGLATIQLFLPDLLILRDAMDGAGYASQGEGAMWVYAREL